MPQYRGIRAVVAPNGQGAAGTIIGSALAAAPGIPDVVEDCCSDFPTYVSAGFLAPLNDQLKVDNINVYNLFIRGHLEALSEDGVIYALPS